MIYTCMYNNIYIYIYLSIISTNPKQQFLEKPCLKVEHVPSALAAWPLKIKQQPYIYDYIYMDRYPISWI